MKMSINVSPMYLQALRAKLLWFDSDCLLLGVDRDVKRYMSSSKMQVSAFVDEAHRATSKISATSAPRLTSRFESSGRVETEHCIWRKKACGFCRFT